MIIHVLYEGFTLCGFAHGQFPGQWPDGHRWTFTSDIESVTCGECLRLLKEPTVHPVKFVRREDVKTRLMTRWAEAIKLAKSVNLGVHVPDWDSVRNYELEALMRDNFGDDGWVVCEWCPYNWISCAYLYGASKHDLKEAKTTLNNWRPQEGMPDINRAHFLGLLDKELASRPAELGEKQYWGKGISDHLERKQREFEKNLEITA